MRKLAAQRQQNRIAVTVKSLFGLIVSTTAVASIVCVWYFSSLSIVAFYLIFCFLCLLLCLCQLPRELGQRFVFFVFSPLEKQCWILARRWIIHSDHSTLSTGRNLKAKATKCSSRKRWREGWRARTTKNDGRMMKNKKCSLNIYVTWSGALYFHFSFSFFANG